MKLITRDHPDFYKSLPNYVFISINAEIGCDMILHAIVVKE